MNAMAHRPIYRLLFEHPIQGDEGTRSMCRRSFLHLFSDFARAPSRSQIYPQR